MKNNFAQNKYPIYTNNFDVKINRENIAKQYAIFQIVTEESFFKTNVLDIAADKFKAQSVAYYRENRWFAIFNKSSVSFNDFRTEIQEIDDTSIVNEVDLFDTDKDSRKNIQDVELAQLLVNSLKNRKSNKFSYNNITGKLYYPISDDVSPKSKTFDMLDIRFFDHNGIIALEADSIAFSEYNSLLKYGHKNVKKNYVFDDKTGEFRKRLDKDTDKDLVFFDRGALSRNGSRTTFLDFSNEDDFRKSKTGIIATFLQDVKEKLGDYIQISQVPLYDYNSYDKNCDEYECKDYTTFLQKKGICVVDTVKTTESKNIRKSICGFLESKYGIKEISKKREQEKYVIEIIHEKDSDFYATKKDEMIPNLFEEFDKPSDPHNSFTENDIIQHITIENFELEHIKDIMNKVIQELIIKGDVLHDKQISLVDWNKAKEWNFVCCGTGVKNNSKNCYEFTYYKMSVSRTGKIFIEKLEPKDSPFGDWNVIDRIFRKYNKENKNKKSSVECIVYENINEINVIYETKQFTLPNVEEIADELKMSNPNNRILKSDVKSYIEEFFKEKNLSDEQKVPFEKILKNMESCFGNDISYSDIFRSKDNNLYLKKIVQEFNEWVRISKGSLLHEQLRRGENKDKNFNSFLGIKTVKQNGTFKYFVGKKMESLQQSVNCSCKIRDVIPWNEDGINPDGKILFDEFAHMLTVDFVRNGQYTVLPFPVKYLNEYIRFCEKDIDFD